MSVTAQPQVLGGTAGSGTATPARPASLPAFAWRWTRRLTWWAVRLCAFGLLLAIAVAAAGWILRDRWQSVCLLFYIPMIVPGTLAVGLDALVRGRALPGPRYGLALAGLIAVVWYAVPMTGRGADPAPAAPAPPRSAERVGHVRLIHWNVMWGGVRIAHKGRRRNNWEGVRAEICARDPDVVVLSEAPMQPMLDGLLADLGRVTGSAWSKARVENDAGKYDYWYHLFVCSRWPLAKERNVPLENGHGMMVRVDAPHGPLRVFVVDGQSTIYQNRGPLLANVARELEASAAAGRPVDVVAGDFNALSRSVGFDAFGRVAGGYMLASRRADGWRGTYPALLPLLDIDHVWLTRRAGGVACEMLNAAGTDHLGQFVRFTVPRSARAEPPARAP
jgi:endonuclease/exonuclease/phosphatase family metal-dependent hydrolase